MLFLVFLVGATRASLFVDKVSVDGHLNEEYNDTAEHHHQNYCHCVYISRRTIKNSLASQLYT